MSNNIINFESQYDELLTMIKDEKLTRYNLCLMFSHTCKNGSLDLLQKLQEISNFTRDEVFCDELSNLRVALNYGNVNIAKWLCKIFSVTPEEIINENENVIFETACECGVLKSVIFLIEYCNIEREHIISMVDGELDNWAFILACSNGHIEVAKYLHEYYKITCDEIMMRNNESFKFAYKGNHREIIKWLCELCNKSEEEMCNLCI